MTNPHTTRPGSGRYSASPLEVSHDFALPLAYASQHLYGDRNPYRPTVTEPVVEARRRRRRLPSLLRRPPRTQPALSTHPAAAARPQCPRDRRDTRPEARQGGLQGLSHQALIYSSETQLADATAAFVRLGLEVETPCS